ncbi:MAG: hypothetical protein AAF990_05780 [Bacteroidota bacterium]
MKRIFIFSVLLLFGAACEDDNGGGVTIDCDARTITYDSDIKAIVDRTCAYSGCHDGDPFSTAPHNYTVYAGMLIPLENGRFRRRVLEQRSMPDPDSVPNGAPNRLTDEELAIIDCWLKAGHPEN